MSLQRGSGPAPVPCCESTQGASSRGTTQCRSFTTTARDIVTRRQPPPARRILRWTRRKPLPEANRIARRRVACVPSSCLLRQVQSAPLIFKNRMQKLKDPFKDEKNCSTWAMHFISKNRPLKIFTTSICTVTPSSICTKERYLGRFCAY